MIVRRSMVVLMMMLTLDVVGCSKPESCLMPTDMSKASSDERFAAAVKKLPQDERDLLVAYVVRAALAQGFNHPLPPAATIGDAIASQRQWAAELKAKEEEQKALAAKVQAARAAAQKQMDDVLTVAVTEKQYKPASVRDDRYLDEIDMAVAFQNKSSKDLKGVKGKLVFKDMFDDLIREARLSMDEGVPATQTATWNGSLSYNQFKPGDQKLAQTSLEKMKITWVPDTYLFADGTALKMPADDDN
jgi:hypothetical protein